MKRFAIPLLEYGSIVLAVVLLIEFFGLPVPGSQHRPAVVGPAPHRLVQGSEQWDKDLVLPTRSDRIASYLVDVELDTSTNIISGWEILDWKNNTGKPQSQFPFHLYHNAWKNNRSTFVKEGGWRLRGQSMGPDDYGYTNVQRVVWVDQKGETDITSTFRYIQPDDNNTDDQTVFEITTPRAIRPGTTTRFKIEFETKQPKPIARTGVIRNYHFVAQWFPKIGVWWKGAWNCHQFHPSSEFFADYGVYNVTLTVPSDFVVGATGGIPRWQRKNEDNTSTYNFYQEDVHDFAWVAAPDLKRTVRVFSHTKIDQYCDAEHHHDLKEVKVILLTQPQHDDLIDRYFDATFKALRFYGEWYGQYPYDALTVVDPANGSRSGGMEYPTLFTGGSNMFSPKDAASPEGVTVHECGHQWWYAMVGSNEFEEPWMDEGFNTYSTARVIHAGWPPFKAVRYFFGGPGAGSYVGIPYVYDDVLSERFTTGNLEIRSEGKNDVMARKSWEFLDSYRLNAYTKPAMSLQMLEHYLGSEMMYRVMRTYQYHFRFKHPTTQDFINTVNKVTGKDMSWFFDNTWFSSNLFDYEISEVNNVRLPKRQGAFTMNGQPVDSSAIPREPTYRCEVVAQRLGEAIAPVDIVVVFADGTVRREQWDGKYRWKRFTYDSKIPVDYAVVDPDRKLVLDVNYNNNSRVAREPGFQSVGARKLASRWLAMIQLYMDASTLWQ